MSKIIVITGPTGVGKTKLSIELAKKYDAEIINADAIQVYKELNIGSAKIKEEEKEGIKHHLIDFLNLDQEYSIYDYQKDCREIIEMLQSKNKNIIIVGGTGLYIKSALYDYSFDSNFKKYDYNNYTLDDLYQELTKVDKDIKIDKYNRRRIEHALDYYKNYGKSISLNNNGNKLLYDAIFIGLTTDRENLYKKIDDRVDKMLDSGLLDEVKNLHNKKIYTKPLLTAIGYKELYQYLDNLITYEEAVRLIKQNSRHYAKRQYTFFRNQFDINWFNTNYSDFSKTIEEVIKYIDEHMIK